MTTLTMAFKLMEVVQKKWFRLRSYKLLVDVIKVQNSLTTLNKVGIRNRWPLDSPYTTFNYSSNESGIYSAKRANQ